MFLSDISVKRPVFATVMSMLLVAFGILSFTSLPVRELPEIEIPIVSIETTYPGASAEVVEKRITQLIEDRIAGVEGIRSITSTSSNGVSAIGIEFEIDHDLEVGINDVRDRVSSVLDNLPEDVDPPEIGKVDINERPVIWLGVTSTVFSQLQLTDYIERNLEERLSVVSGVARLRVSGRKRPAIRVWLDRQAMAARGLTVAEIESTMRSENVELPAGRLESNTRDFTVRIDRIYRTPDDFRKMTLKEGPDGHLIQLGEVARVEVAPEDLRTEYRRNGVTSQSIGVIKQSQANLLEVAQAIREKVDEMQSELPPHVTFDVSWDSSQFVEEAISEVYKTLFIAIALVVFVIYLFLGSFRAAFVPAVTVPVALIGTFWALGIADYSINMMTLLALVLTIGLVVDDSIVVLENCHRRVELGEPALLAAFKGSRQVAFAVIATTLVLISVFLPVFFLDGMIARLFMELAVTVAAAVGFSSFVALTLSAMLCSKVLSRKEKKGWLRIHLDHWFETIGRNYSKLLRTVFTNKAPVFLMLAGSLVMIVGLFMNINIEFDPQEDRGGFFMMARGPEGTGFEKMREQAIEIESKLIPAYEDGRIQTILINVPGWRSTSEAVNTMTGIAILKNWKERDFTTQDMETWARDQFSTITDTDVFIQSFGSGGSGGGASELQYVIGAGTYEELAGIRDRVEARLAQNPNILKVDSDYLETQPQIRVEVDRDRAADLGVSVSTIGRSLEVTLAGRRVTTFVDRGEEYYVFLQAEAENRSDPSDIDNIFVRSFRTGELIPLSSLVKIRNVADSGTLNRYNRVRSLTLTITLAPGYALQEAVDYLNQVALEEAPEATNTDLKGDARELQDALVAFLFTLSLALLVVYLVLAAQFESFIHPFTIMLTVPLAIAGGLLGLYITGHTLNIYSMVGMIILIGIAAKNGFLIVEFANQLRDEGQGVTDAVVNAARIRLRPVLMTGISTAVGALPLVLAGGPGAASRSSIGVFIFFGVVIATFFTLIVIPMFYNMLGKYTGSPGFIERKLRLQEKDISLGGGAIKDKRGKPKGHPQPAE